MHRVVPLIALVACGRIDFASLDDGAHGSHPAMPFTLEVPGMGNRIRAIAMQPDGTVAVVGDLVTATTFGDIPLASSGLGDVLVALIEPDGTPRWARTLGGADDDSGRAVAFGADGAILAGGKVSGPIMFAGGSVTTQFRDAFIASYAPDGTEQWMRAFGGSHNNDVNADDGVDAIAIAIDGDIYASGACNGDVDFGDGMIAPDLGGYDSLFVARFSRAGAFRWSWRGGDTRYNEAYAVDTDAFGGVYISGLYEGTPDFGTGPVPYRGIQDAVVVGFDNAGTVRWVRTFGGSGFDWPLALAVLDGTIAVGGHYENTIDIAGVPTAVGASDAFVTTFALDGTPGWTRAFGGAGCDSVKSLHAGGGEWLLSGEFSGPIDFGGPRVPTAASDAILATLAPDGTPTFVTTTGMPGNNRSDGLVGARATGMAYIGYLSANDRPDCLGPMGLVGLGLVRRL